MLGAERETRALVFTMFRRYLQMKYTPVQMKDIGDSIRSGAIRRDEGIPLLVQLFRDEKKGLGGRVRTQIVYILGKLKAKEALPALIEALNEETKISGPYASEVPVRYMAALMLEEIGGDEAMAALKARLAVEQDSGVRYALKRALDQ
jgi:HEAT repeat protein